MQLHNKNDSSSNGIINHNEYTLLWHKRKPCNPLTGIQWIPVNRPLLGPGKKWPINRNGRWTDRFLVIQRRKKKFGTGENWPINRKWLINRWPINRNPLYVKEGNGTFHSTYRPICMLSQVFTLYRWCYKLIIHIVSEIRLALEECDKDPLHHDLDGHPNETSSGGVLLAGIVSGINVSIGEVMGEHRFTYLITFMHYDH